MTIVRPSHTYDPSKIPLFGGYTTLAAHATGPSRCLVYGDGTSLWTLTHHGISPKALCRCWAIPARSAKSFHITSDEWLTWNQIYEIMGQALGVQPQLVHVPSDLIARLRRRNWARAVGRQIATA